VESSVSQSKYHQNLEAVFLEKNVEWMSKPGVTTFLVGPESGSLSLNIETKTFARTSSGMSKELKEQLVNAGCTNNQSTAHQTHAALKGSCDFPLKASILVEAAQDRLLDEDPDYDAPS
jgi:hypothetical protein